MSGFMQWRQSGRFMQTFLKYGCMKAYGSYADLVADKKVDLIYVATPHSEHYENVKDVPGSRKAGFV